jgi:hypothetical protein
MHLNEPVGRWLCTLGIISDAELQAASSASAASGKRRGFDLTLSSSDSIVGGRAFAQAILALAASGIVNIPPSERETLRQAAVPLRSAGSAGAAGRRSEPAERLYAWNAVAPALGRLLPAGAGLSADDSDKVLLVAGDDVGPPAAAEILHHDS